MRNAKKFLSILFAAVLLLSSVSVAAFALTSENADYANVKYNVKQTDTLVVGGEEYDLSGTDHAGKVYALTISVKAARGISYLQIPYYYNMDKFGQITLYDGTDMYYAYPGYYSDMGENAVYDVYSLGPAWSDAGQYKADGSTAANAMQTKAFGLAHSSVAGAYTIVTNIVDPTTIGYDLWCAGIEDKGYTVGCGYFTISNTFAKNKSAYINAVNGKVVVDDYVDIMTVYLYNFDGEATGEEIGAYTDWEKDSVNNIQVTWCTTDASGYPMNGHINNTSKYGSSWASFIENAVIEAAATPELELAALKQQIRFPANKETFDYRIFANITNLEEIFGDVAGVNDKSDNTYMTEAGFIFNLGAIDQDAALTQINGGEVTYGEVNPETGRNPNHQKNAYISTSTGLADYAMACVIYDIPYDAANETVSVLAYVKYVQDGEAKVALVDAYTGTFEPLFSTHKPA